MTGSHYAEYLPLTAEENHFGEPRVTTSVQRHHRQQHKQAAAEDLNAIAIASRNQHHRDDPPPARRPPPLSCLRRSPAGPSKTGARCASTAPSRVRDKTKRNERKNKRTPSSGCAERPIKTRTSKLERLRWRGKARVRSRARGQRETSTSSWDGIRTAPDTTTGVRVSRKHPSLGGDATQQGLRQHPCSVPRRGSR